MFATATALMMLGVARARIVGSASCVTAWPCEELVTESAIDLIMAVIYGRRALQLCAPKADPALQQTITSSACGLPAAEPSEGEEHKS